MALEARAHAAGVSRPPALACCYRPSRPWTLSCRLSVRRGSAGSMRERWQAGGRSLRQLGQLARARQQANVLTLHRSIGAKCAFGQLVLARVLIEERDLDEASEVGRDVLDSTRRSGRCWWFASSSASGTCLPPTGRLHRSPNSWSTLMRNCAGVVLYRSFSADEPG